MLRNLFEPSKDARVAEIAELIGKLDQSPFAITADVDEVDPLPGYEAWSEVYDSFNPLIEAEQPMVWAVLDSLPVGVALDAACGTGRHSAHLSATGWTVIGVDQSEPMLARARTKAPSARFEVGSLTSLPVDDESVDVVVCALALTHLTSLDTAVGDFARVVRTGGRVVLSDIHPFASLTLGQAFFETQDGRRLFVRNHVHLPSAYLSAFAAHGLSVRRCAEPLMTEEWLPRLAVGFSREATAEAYVGLPFALIWDLEKT